MCTLIWSHTGSYFLFDEEISMHLVYECFICTQFYFWKLRHVPEFSPATTDHILHIYIHIFLRIVYSRLEQIRPTFKSLITFDRSNVLLCVTAVPRLAGFSDDTDDVRFQFIVMPSVPLILIQTFKSVQFTFHVVVYKSCLDC